MKYYDEVQTGEIRKALEKEILRWPGVTSRQMMGCLCYFYGKKFFAFLVTNAIVITKLSDDERTKLSKHIDTSAFEMAGRTAKTWIRVALKKPNDLKLVLPFVKKSYEAASTTKK